MGSVLGLKKGCPCDLKRSLCEAGDVGQQRLLRRGPRGASAIDAKLPIRVVPDHVERAVCRWWQGVGSQGCMRRPGGVGPPTSNHQDGGGEGRPPHPPAIGLRGFPYSLGRAARTSTVKFETPDASAVVEKARYHPKCWKWVGPGQKTPTKLASLGGGGVGAAPLCR